jgi:hypothetical protein
VNIVLWGRTGTGKTRFCYEQIKDSTYWSPGDYQWFDGYEGQRIVIIDDYRGEYPLPLFLKLLDRYPMRVPVKGSFVEWCPKKIFITSNIEPAHWYQTDYESNCAMLRRLNTIHNITSDLYE